VAFTKDTTQNSDGIIAEISGVITNLLPKLNAAKQHGFARVLKSSSVTTKEGQQGVVNATQNLPILIRQPGNVGAITNSSVPVGVESTITPTISNPRSDIIQLDMQFRVSSLIGQTDQGPQTASNFVKTIVDVRSGQSAAIGGLIENTTGTEFNPDSNPDALFNLYSAKDFRRNKSQFVVFVTPIIKPSASAGSEKIKRKFRLRE
jgi:pilus assembly protein CpaC